MDKKLQDLAWQCLPLEVKKEVKRLYKTRRNKRLNEVSSDFIYCLVYIFGKHNLTSDAEGEEMLMCAKSRIQQQYKRASQLKDDSDPKWEFVGDQIERVLIGLFGSKFLPDACNVASNVASKEPKPAEPKYKHNVGDEVKYKLDGEVHKIAFIDKGLTALPYQLKNGMWASESDLEPYTEPTDKNPKENANTFASDEPTGTKSGNFDHMNGFRNHHRMHIASMAMQGLLANPALMEEEPNFWYDEDKVARCALRYADALIAECNSPIN